MLAFNAVACIIFLVCLLASRLNGRLNLILLGVQGKVIGLSSLESFINEISLKHSASFFHKHFILQKTKSSDFSFGMGMELKFVYCQHHLHRL